MQEAMYIYDQNKPLVQPPEADSYWRKLLFKFAKIVAALGFVSLVVAYGPNLWYAITGGYEQVGSILARPAGDSFGQIMVEAGDREENIYQPRFDPSLPTQNSLSIPSAGIKTTINEAALDNYEEALRKGVWRVSNFSTPVGRDNPTILAAHKIGYLNWGIAYRLRNSFYNLFKASTGDTVEIVWNQRKYIYEIYAESEGGAIEDYSADLVLYTCKGLNSPIRVFKYARLIEV